MVFHRLRSLIKTRRRSRECNRKVMNNWQPPIHSPSLEDILDQLRISPTIKTPIRLPETNSAVYIRNLQCCRLYQLPEELVLMIGDNLKPIQIHALRLVGRLFHRVFEAPTYPGPIEVRKLARLMEEDVYLWYCRRERAFGTADARNLTCSKCRCLHSRSDFTDEQITADHMKRVCKGAEARVWLCEHASMTFDEVVGLRQRNIIVNSNKILDFKICTHADHGSNATELAQGAPMISAKNDGTYIVSRSITIASVQTDSHLSKDEWEQYLSNRSEIVCPHINLHDHEVILPTYPITWHRFPFEPEEEDYPFYKSKLDILRRDCTLGYCRNCNSIQQSCRKTGCSANWTLSRRHGASSSDPDEYAIDIKRTFCIGHDQTLKPMHQTWQAQTKQPEQFDKITISGQSLEVGKSFLESRKGEFDPFIIYLRASGIQGSAQAIYWEELPSLYRNDSLVLV